MQKSGSNMYLTGRRMQFQLIRLDNSLPTVLSIAVGWENPVPDMILDFSMTEGQFEAFAEAVHNFECDLENSEAPFIGELYGDTEEVS